MIVLSPFQPLEFTLQFPLRAGNIQRKPDRNRGTQRDPKQEGASYPTPNKNGEPDEDVCGGDHHAKEGVPSITLPEGRATTFRIRKQGDTDRSVSSLASLWVDDEG